MGIFVKLADMCGKLKIRINLTSTYLRQAHTVSPLHEKFIKTVQKAATAKGMTVAEYRDKILFPHGKERITARFKQYLKLHPEAEGKPTPPIKNNSSAMAMRKSVSKK